ncbi:MAG: hypothetical protein DRN06_01615 [Thermoprotei archaeon]|nr:MAG: hypothetical protein DRN06_01615 [Thermoprotei archaeon]
MVETREDGSVLYSFEEAVQITKGLVRPGLAVDELILLLLGLVDKPINGKVVMQKELFLLYNELKDHLNVVDPHFIKYKYGPFSIGVATLLELLESAGYIKILNKRSKRRAKYYLTAKGREAAKNVLNRLSSFLGEDVIARLKELRRGWDQLGHDGILRYVYQRFPQYREKAELKDKYIHVDWGVTEA